MKPGQKVKTEKPADKPAPKQIKGTEAKGLLPGTGFTDKGSEQAKSARGDLVENPEQFFSNRTTPPTNDLQFQWVVHHHKEKHYLKVNLVHLLQVEVQDQLRKLVTLYLNPNQGRPFSDKGQSSRGSQNRGSQK